MSLHFKGVIAQGPGKTHKRIWKVRKEAVTTITPKIITMKKTFMTKISTFNKIVCIPKLYLTFTKYKIFYSKLCGT